MFADISWKGYGDPAKNLGLNGRLEFSLTLLAPILLYSILFVFLFFYWRLSHNRMIRIRGVTNSLLLGNLLSALCCINVGIFMDDPSSSCAVIVSLFVFHLIPLCHTFEMFVLRFHRLYRLNAMTVISFGSQNTASDASMRFKHNNRRARRRLLTIIRIINGFFAAGMVISIVLYDLKPPYANQIPDTYNKCVGGNSYMHLILGLFAINGVVVVILLFPILRELNVHAKYMSDSMGIRRALQRICLQCFCAMVLLIGSGIGMLFDMHVRWAMGVFALILFALYLDVIVIPVIRAILDMKEHRTLEAALRAGDELGLDRNVALLKAFLQTKDGYDAVAQHLRRELGFETLDFIIEVTRYKQRFKKPKKPKKGKTSRTSKVRVDPVADPVTGTNEEMVKECKRIYRKFIWSKAEYQVNLPDNFTRKFAALEVTKVSSLGYTTRKLGFNLGDSAKSKDNRNSSKKYDPTASPASTAPMSPPLAPTIAKAEKLEITENIFDDCVREVLNMLFYDSFQRFLKTPMYQDLWIKFQREMSHVSSLSGLRRSSSVRNTSVTEDDSSSTPSNQIDSL